MTKPKKIELVKAGWFDWFLLTIILRIARHWHCSIEFSKSKNKYGKDRAVKWMKIIFTEIR